MVVTMTKTRAERAAALEAWADAVDPADLRDADTDALRRIAQLAQQRAHLDAELTTAVVTARAHRRSWSEIGAMLGVSKQAAQRKYGTKTTA
jgi:predicted ATP-dependent protease